MAEEVKKRELNLSKERVKVEILDPQVRKCSFEEIVKSFRSLEDAQLEARRCLRCPKKPCAEACPLGNDIPEFIAAIENGEIETAKRIINAKSALSAVCSRVCPQEKQCEGACTRGKNGESVNIGALERFASAATQTEAIADTIIAAKTKFAGKQVAVVGAGPAGLSAADFLSRERISVTVFERRSFPGGVLEAGIPKFRLPKNIIRTKVEELQKQGVKFVFNCEVSGGETPSETTAPATLETAKPSIASATAPAISNATINSATAANATAQSTATAGSTTAPKNASAPETSSVTAQTTAPQQTKTSLQELKNEFDAIFLASGADKPKLANLQNEQTDGVIQAKDFLEEINFSSDCANLMIGETVIVVGGGNVAMDVAACATRAGAKSVTIVYRRSLEELPARAEEIELNKEEGVIYHLLASPVSVEHTVTVSGTKTVKSLTVQKVELGEPDESGRRTPVCKVGSDYEIPCSKIIVAIGSDVDETAFSGQQQIQTDANNRIIVDESYRTSDAKIWAGGDNVTGPLTVVSAVKAGREAAKSIISVL